MNKHTVVQGFEPKPEGGDEPYWMVLAESGIVMDVFDTEQAAVDHAKLLNAPTPPAPVDLLAAKNAEIAELKAENERLQSVIDGIREIVNGAKPADYPVFSIVSDINVVLYELEQPHPAPVQAVTLTYSDNPEMSDDYSGHDYDVDVVGWLAEHQITAGNLRGDFAVTNIGESIQAWVYKFCSDITPTYLTDECYFDKYFRLKPEYDTPANRAAIAARRAELGLS